MKLPRLRRFFRYSLRSLLILVTICAISVNYFINKFGQQQRVTDMTEHLGGTCWYEHETTNMGPPGPEWLRNFLGDHYFCRIWDLYLSGTQVTDEMLSQLAGMTSLTDLELYDTDITDAGVVHLRGLENITWLDLSDTQVTDAGMVHIASLTNISSLHLERTGLTDAGLVELESISSLRELCICGAPVTAEGVASFSERRPKVRIGSDASRR